MPNLAFVGRTEGHHLFQFRRPGFLSRGTVTVQDGFVTVVNDDGTEHTTTYAVVRPYTFFDPDTPKRTGIIHPGDLGINPLNFTQGQVSIRPPSKKVVLVTSSPTHQFYDGRVTIVGAADFGALTDFAIWPNGQPD